VVKLNSNDHLLLTPYFNIEGMKNWKILPDESLKPGEVSCEMDGVGIHFSPELAIQEVERILNTKPGQP
jgi:flagellar biosynthesis/type III secretory pathway protein FliH